MCVGRSCRITGKIPPVVYIQRDIASSAARLPRVIDSIVENGYLEMQGSGSYSRSFDRQEALYTVVIHR